MKKIIIAALLVFGVSASAGTNVDNTNNVVLINNPTYVENVVTHVSEPGRASFSALSSVELNPDHEGFSVSVGGSSYHGIAAGALGVGYGIKTEKCNIGINAKGYDAEGGYRGGSVGVSLGF